MIVSVAQLKFSFIRYLARVKEGEELIVTERGKPIARIVPIRHTSVSGGVSDLQELEKSGLIRRAKKRLSRSFWTAVRLKDPKGLVLATHLKERREGR